MKAAGYFDVKSVYYIQSVVMHPGEISIVIQNTPVITGLFPIIQQSLSATHRLC